MSDDRHDNIGGAQRVGIAESEPGHHQSAGAASDGTPVATHAAGTGDPDSSDTGGHGNGDGTGGTATVTAGTGEGVDQGADGAVAMDAGEDTFTAFYQVHNRLVGLIIGKGGESVKLLKDQTGATVRLTRDSDQDPRLETREMCITGTLSQLNSALSQIKERLDDAHSKKVGSGDSVDSGSSTCPPDQMIITVPNHCVGLLIGKGGSTIKEMNDASGCHIQIAKDVAAVGFPREVTLSGLPSQILDAQNEINRRLSTVQEKLGGYMNLNKPFQVPMQGGAYANRYQHREVFNTDPVPQPPPGVSVHQQSGDGRVMTVSIPNGKTGLLIGKGAQTLRQMQEQSGALITIPKDSDVAVASTHRDITVSGEPTAVQNAVNIIQNKLVQSDKPAGAQAAEVPPGAHSTAFKVPNEKVGLLIGKGGSTFKEMQMQTGARIFIPKEPGPDGQREITISGDPVCITNAYYLIHGKIASSNNPGSGAYTSAQAAAAAYSAYASYNAYSSYFQNYQQGQPRGGASGGYGGPAHGAPGATNQYQSYTANQFPGQSAGQPPMNQGFPHQGFATQQSQATQGLPTPAAPGPFAGTQPANYGVNQATQGYGGNGVGNNAGPYGHY